MGTADVQGMSSREGAGSAWLPLSVESASMARAEQPAANDQVEGAGAAALAPMTLPVDLPTLLRELEDAYIRAALARTQCNKKEAAKPGEES
jgi:DNA-binding NtrC family response regulator